MTERLEMSPERMIEALNNEVRLRDIEIERLCAENEKLKKTLANRKLSKVDADYLRNTAYAWWELGKKDRQIAIQLLLEDGTLRFTDHFELTDKKLNDE